MMVINGSTKNYVYRDGWEDQSESTTEGDTVSARSMIEISYRARLVFGFFLT